MPAESTNESKGVRHDRVVDRRRHPRFKVDLHVTFRPVYGDGTSGQGPYSAGRVLNLSEGGMLMQVQSPLRVGQRIEIRMNKQGKPTLAFGIVKVVRCVRRAARLPCYDVGLEFEKP
jgi:c-di-GMP-binding flagellar brake protein YcgR